MARCFKYSLSHDVCLDRLIERGMTGLDRELRLLAMDALERIGFAVLTAWAYLMAHALNISGLLMHQLTIGRNVCAHHSQRWNRELPFQESAKKWAMPDPQLEACPEPLYYRNQ